MVWHAVPLVGILLFYGFGFCWRTWLHVRRYGSSGIMLFRSGRRAQDVRDALVMVLVLVTFGQAVVAAVAPEDLAALGPVVPPGWRVAGAALLLGATGVMLVAQLDLGASWRVGIEEGARPGLVTTGLYRFSRNPIFFCMLLALTGFTLLLPNWLSFATLLGAVLGIRRQVLEEEAYLVRVYGGAYRAYATRVGRFVPWVGRLS